MRYQQNLLRIQSIVNRLRERLAQTILTAGLVGLAGCTLMVQAEDFESTGKSTPLEFNIDSREFAMKTFGGRQFWSDVLFFHGWRIQQNYFTEHYRLLDKDDHRHASGTLKFCKQQLEEIKREKKLKPMSGKAVIFVHGIIRSSKSFNKMKSQLEAEGYSVYGFDYPSTRVEISKGAESLHSVIESLDGVEEISFVVHSMGGLVVRSYLDKHRDKRIKRMVMLGVPNLGAKMADQVKELSLFKTIFGPAGQQLVSDPDGLIAKLPTPDFEFAVIAGSRGTEDGYNPLVPGDDDGTVSVTSTRLPGASDFAKVNVLHSFMVDDKQVIEQSVRFIKTGALRKSGKKEPISQNEAKKKAPPAD